MSRKINLPGGKAFQELSAAYPQYFTSGRGRRLSIKEVSEPGYHLVVDAKEIRLSYQTRSDLFRALGVLAARLRAGKVRTLCLKETPPVKWRGLMVDVSRNGVIRPDYLKGIICVLALMGYNYLTLYTEDTYQVVGHPLIGYRRGAYSQRELRELARYAALFGIEMFPCIQVLGHLEQVLKFPAYQALQDNHSVLSVKLEKSYELVEAMIESAAAPYASRLIHLGMDETHGLGQGRTFESGKPIEPRHMYLKHLKKVASICRRRGLQPVIWGDILTNWGMTRELIRKEHGIDPEGLGVVYWNYYSSDGEVYGRDIKHYRKLGFEPIIAPGVWNWSRFWGYYPHAEATIAPCMIAAKQQGVERALLTMWGDNGQEAPFASNYPALALFAEQCYQHKAGLKQAKAMVAALCGDDWDSFVAPTRLDQYGRAAVHGAPNLSRCLIYDDPLLGLYAAHVGGRKLGPYYQKLARQLKGLRRKVAPKNKNLFAFAQALAECLELKADLWGESYRAYKKGDRRKLAGIVKGLPEISKRVRVLWLAQRRIWLEERKPQGLETLDLRYGGLMARLDVMRQRLAAFLRGDIERIEELEEKPQNIYGQKFPARVPRYDQLSSISTIK